MQPKMPLAFIIKHIKTKYAHKYHGHNKQVLDECYAIWNGEKRSHFTRSKIERLQSKDKAI